MNERRIRTVEEPCKYHSHIYFQISATGRRVRPTQPGRVLINVFLFFLSAHSAASTLAFIPPQHGSGRNSDSTNSSSYQLQRWEGETSREEPWSGYETHRGDQSKGGETKEVHISRSITRINNFDKRWYQSDRR
ncbi:hypothetical protein F5Y03DRAFT_27287 [Xylaria venustula]|nr:hypothetical protein F5Y03DRAFT_27287 [Xylaria venustula]